MFLFILFKKVLFICLIDNAFPPSPPRCPLQQPVYFFPGQPLYLWILDFASLPNVSFIRGFVRMS